MKTVRVSFENPRAWMVSSYQKNLNFFREKVAQDEPISWTPNVMAGSVCLSAIEYAVTCFGAGDQEIATGLLARGRRIIKGARDYFGQASERDRINLDRPTIAIACRLGSILDSEGFGSDWAVPYDAFPPYIRSVGELGDVELQNAAKFLWALLAIFEEKPGEYRNALDLKMKKHRELRGEMELVPKLGRVVTSSADVGWSEYETVLARWLNPVIETESYAENFRGQFAAVLALVWCMYRLKRLDREALLKTYFGETVSIPVPVI